MTESGYTLVPYTIAYANELVEDPIYFEWHAHEYRLTYGKPRRSDWVNGILRARVRDLRNRPDRRGPERMRKLNTARQWRCMDKLLCQVCSEPATDPETGRIPWALTTTVFERTGSDSGRTNAPPCCLSCIPKAMEQCPMLRDDFTFYTATTTTSAGVLADLYHHGLFDQPILAKHNVFVAWDAVRHHAYALAGAQVVELHGMKSLQRAQVLSSGVLLRQGQPAPSLNRSNNGRRKGSMTAATAVAQLVDLLATLHNTPASDP